MSPDERIEYAKKLINSTDYGSNKSHLIESISECNEILQMEFSHASEESNRHISNVRTLLWVVILTMSAILLLTFIMFYSWIITPLRSYTKLITSDKSLEKRGAIKELRLVAAAYNELLRRREKLEKFLRTEAETDSLTGMPNRYSFDKYILGIDEDGGNYAVALFDVDYLKRVNDMQGHLAGDKLICSASSCIRECFGTEKADNCYRIGGDEFAAFIPDCNEEEMKSRMDRFELAIERENISVSVGYFIGEVTGEVSVNDLVSQADKRMYENKKHVHETNREHNLRI